MSFIREHVVKRCTRSNGWRKVRNLQIKLFPRCAVCGTKKTPEAHHIKSFKNKPELELDPDNLITLCRRCHFVFGHCFYWRAINKEILRTVEFIKGVKNRRVL